MSNIYNVEEYGTIVSHETDLLSEYDVTNKNFCINITPRKIKDIFKEVENQLPKELMNEFDYYVSSFPFIHTTNIAEAHFDENGLFPEFHWIAIYYVLGGSEGYYVHVATINDEEHHEMVWVAKTLYEGTKGKEVCRKLVAALEDIIKP